MEYLALASIFGYALAVKRRCDAPSDFLPIVTVAGVTTVLYCAALIGMLRGAAVVVLIIGLCLIPFTWVRDRGRFFATVASLCTPGVTIFFVSSLVYRLHFDDIGFYNWDTFAHWGLATKELLSNGELDRVRSALVLTTYPPGIAIFHYFMLFFSSYSEDFVCYANFVLLGAPLASTMSNIGWKRPILVAAVACLAYFLISAVGQSIRDIPPDHTLGLYFGAAVLYYLKRPSNESSHTDGLILLGLPCLFILPLIKEIGAPLAAVAVVIAASDLAQRAAHVGRLGNRSFHATLAMMVVVPLTAAMSWAVYVDALKVPRNHSWHLDAGDAWRVLISGERNEIQEQTIHNFLAALADKTVGDVGTATGAIVNGIAWWLAGGDAGSTDISKATIGAANYILPEWPISVVALSAALGIAMIGFVMTQGDRFARRRWTVAFFWLGLGAVAYLFAHLLLYLFAFGAYEGPRLASYSRYIGIYFLGAGVVVVGCLAEGAAAADLFARRFSSLAIFSALLAVLMVAPRKSVAILVHKWPEPIELRQKIRTQVDHLSRHFGDGKRVYVVWQNTSGFEHRILMYELAPRPINRSCWSIGEPYDQGDVWTCPIRSIEWSNRLKGYDAVLIGHVDDRFWREFGTLFEPQPGARQSFLFTVGFRSDGSLALTP